MYEKTEHDVAWADMEIKGTLLGFSFTRIHFTLHEWKARDAVKNDL